ncbi:BCCT family transporter [Xanthomonas populi]|uniref:BCCT family transporter n=1 Tax=Xanthomonas populi TaxID=53414 RepID=UPI00244B2392|nr:BCCT family transporter [Xanthomonas populi]
MITVTVAISFVLFITSDDSGTVVVSALSSHSSEPHNDGPRWLRVFWGVFTANAITVPKCICTKAAQDYDLVGYSREQIINDIIDQYERHLQSLHLTH